MNHIYIIFLAAFLLFPCEFVFPKEVVKENTVIPVFENALLRHAKGCRGGTANLYIYQRPDPVSPWRVHRVYRNVLQFSRFHQSHE